MCFKSNKKDMLKIQKIGNINKNVSSENNKYNDITDWNRSVPYRAFIKSSPTPSMFTGGN